jgi:enoyl-CoA hydratase/carnithine racemase
VTSVDASPPARPACPGVRLTTTPLGMTVLIDRPARRNALTLDMWRTLPEQVTRLAEQTTGPVHLMGAGGYFCSGADLDALAWARHGEAEAVEFVTAVVGCLMRLHTLDRQVVAVVEGGAAGGGVEIMAACDRRVAIGSPCLVFPFGHHGIELDGLTRWRLGQIVGEDEARRLLDGRHVVEADEARRLGLFDEQHDSLEEFARAEATPASGPPPGDRSSYLRPDEDLGAAVGRAAEPMLRAFPPHRRR